MIPEAALFDMARERPVYLIQGGRDMNINNITGLQALRGLSSANKLKNQALAKLSSGQKINQASDNPAGLVISEYLRSQLSGLNRAIQNSQEAYNTLSIAEGGMTEMSSMLADAKSLAVHALNSGVTSGNQIAADQSQLNSILSTITRIAGTTSYASKQLLDGSQAIQFRADDPNSMLNTSASSIRLVSDNPGTVDVSFAGGAAAQAEKAYVTSANTGSTTLTSDQAFTVSGNTGSASFAFGSGTALADMASQINAMTDATGVSAYAVNGDTQLRLVSNAYGASEEVRVIQQTGDLFAAEGATVSDAGQNATLTVKGSMVQTDGLSAEVANASFTGTLAFNEAAIGQTGYDQDTLINASATAASVGNIQGGMRLQLAETSSSTARERIGIPSMQTASLGQITVNGQSYNLADLFSGGRASLANQPEIAAKVLDQAITDVASSRANLGSYQANTLQRNINSLSVAFENTTATESNIRDTDYAEQMTSFIRAKLLSDVGVTNVQAANVNASSVLKLLGSI